MSLVPLGPRAFPALHQQELVSSLFLACHRFCAVLQRSSKQAALCSLSSWREKLRPSSTSTAPRPSASSFYSTCRPCHPPSERGPCWGPPSSHPPPVRAQALHPTAGHLAVNSLGRSWAGVFRKCTQDSPRHFPGPTVS